MNPGDLVRRKSGKIDFGLGVVLGEDLENPYLKDYLKVAWIPCAQHPVGWDDNIYIDHVEKKNLIVVST